MFLFLGFNTVFFFSNLYAVSVVGVVFYDYLVNHYSIRTVAFCVLY